MRESISEHEIAISEGERLRIRQVRSSDAEAVAQMLAASSPEDIRFRCFGAVKDFPHVMAERLVKIDVARETTLIAESSQQPGTLMGIVHIINERDEPGVAEFDIMVRSDHKGHGLGYRLMQEILDEARRKGLRAVEGFILRDNEAMLLMARELGFTRIAVEDDMVRMRADIRT